MPESLTDQLERVQEAIATIERGAQAFTVLGRTYQRAEIGKLYARERELKTLIDRAQSGGIRVRYARPTSG